VTRRLVFVDTAALVALTSATDELHTAAERVHGELLDAGARLFVSHWVLTEFLGWNGDPQYRLAASRVADAYLASPSTTVLEATGDDWLRAFALFKDRADIEWSLVDCASMLSCQQHGIPEVFSTDHHFTQAGLSILLPT